MAGWPLREMGDPGERMPKGITKETEQQPGGTPYLENGCPKDRADISRNKYTSEGR